MARLAVYICCDETDDEIYLPHNVHSSCFVRITITSQSRDNISINMNKIAEGHLVKQSRVVTRVSCDEETPRYLMTALSRKRFVVVHLSLCFVINFIKVISSRGEGWEDNLQNDLK